MEKLTPEFIYLSHIDVLLLQELLGAVAAHAEIDFYSDEAARFLRVLSGQMDNFEADL